MKTNKVPKLETGMLVECADGDIGMVINDTIMFDDAFMQLKDLNTDLKNSLNNECNIQKVSNVLTSSKYVFSNRKTHLNRNLLWERVLDHIEVELNDSYTAKVFTDRIEVGCQTIPISKISSLQTALKKLKKQQS